MRSRYARSSALNGVVLGYIGSCRISMACIFFSMELQTRFMFRR